MTQTDLNVANAPGATVRADINDHLEALATLNSGATAPTVTVPNMWWFDESTNILKQRNLGNTAWILVAQKDASGWRGYWNEVLLDLVFLKRINDLTAETAPAITDELGFYDISAAADRKITFENWLKVINGLTEETAVDGAADFLALYDASAAAIRKVKPNNLASGVLTRQADKAASGTATLSFTIPAGADEIILTLDVLSSGGSGDWLVQLGDSGGIETTGYTSKAARSGGEGSVVTNGFVLSARNAAAALSTGVARFFRRSGNKWFMESNLMLNGDENSFAAGSKELSGEATTLQILTTAVDTMDNGVVGVATR